MEAVDVVFTSHTLEHIPELEKTISDIHDTLKVGGYAIIHIPSYQCKRWHKGFKNARGKHEWTFCLSKDNVEYTEIDTLIDDYFDTEIAEHCGDDSILIVGRKV